MRFLKQPLVLVAAMLSAGAFASAEDLTIVSKVSKDGGTPQTSTSYLTNDRIRMAHGDGRDAIIDYKASQMISIDNNKKTYSITTQKEMDEMAAKLEEQMNSPEVKKAREAMKDLPPEQRRAIESFGAGLVEVEKVGTSRKVAGYTCENYTLKIGGMSRSDECLSTELKFPVQAFGMYKKYMESMRAAMGAIGAMGIDYEKMKEQFAKLKGYPLANTTTIDVMGHKSVTQSEVVEIKHTPIPASVFEIPAGYTKVDSPMLKGLDGRKKH